MEKARSTNYVHDDLALCILSKLPLKSLKRFGCVRKSWSLLFENHDFMNMYRNNFISYHHSCYDDTVLMLQLNRDDLYSLSGDDYEDIVKLNWQKAFQEEEEDPCFFVLDSSSINGILCLYKGCSDDDQRTSFWNPTTDEFRIIPPSPLHLESPYLKILVEPVGYGYDKVRDDYKLIRYVHYFSRSWEECEEIGIPYIHLSYDDLWEIYSLKNNTWKKLDSVDPKLHWFLPGVCGIRAYINEMCHWWDFSPAESDDGGLDLVSFDFVNEVLCTTPTPFNIYSDYIFLTELNGSIASISWVRDMTVFDILILGEIGVKESWIKLYSIGPFSCNIKQTIGAGNNGDVFFLKEDEDIVWYNLRTQMMEELYIKGDMYNSHILTYKSSHLPMGGVNY